MESTPLLFWYALDGSRKGLLHQASPMRHVEEVRERDDLYIVCRERPEKYDRVLWRDAEDGIWREHYVREVRALGDGTCEAVCEGALFETRLDFMEAFRLENASYYSVLSKIVPYTRFESGTYGFGGVSEGTAWITRKSVPEAIRKVEEIYNVEFFLDIEVDEDAQRVGSRKLSFSAEQGAWRGLRLTRGKSLDKGSLVEQSDDVVTALFGYGSSFGAYDEDGNATGGFTRRLTFGSVNGGVNYVEDSRAKERYGRKNADGTYRNNFGHVIFDDIEKADALYRKTHEELQRRTSPKVTYEVEGDVDMSEQRVGLGDTVMVTDEVAGVRHRCGMRVIWRERTFGKDFCQKVRLGSVTASARSAFEAYERRCGKVATFDDALVAAGLKEPGGVVAPRATLSVSLTLKSAKRVDGTDIDLRYDFDVAEDDVYRYNLVVRNNLNVAVYGVSVDAACAGVAERNIYIPKGVEKLYTFSVSPAATDVTAGTFTCSASASCPAGNVGLASEYAACNVSAAHTLPESSVPKPVDTIPSDLAGDGTFENPYTVADMRRCVCVSSNDSAIEDVWLCGYIVGWADMDATSGLTAATLHLGAASAVASNIVIADAASETDVARMCAVNLSTATKRRKAVRAALNLQDNPQMAGVRVWMQGDVLRYGRETGMKRTDEYRFCDASGKWHGWWTIDGSLGESLKGAEANGA